MLILVNIPFPNKYWLPHLSSIGQTEVRIDIRYIINYYSSYQFRAEYTSSGISHVEGGWPKDINMNDPEATQRYRRKIEKDDAYIHAVMHLGHVSAYNIEYSIIKLNNLGAF